MKIQNIENFKFLFNNSSLAQKILAGRVIKSGEIIRYDHTPGQSIFFIDENLKMESIKDSVYLYPPEILLSVNFTKMESLATALNFEDQSLLDMLLNIPTKVHEKTYINEVIDALKKNFNSRHIPIGAFLMSRQTANKLTKPDQNNAAFGINGSIEEIPVYSISYFHTKFTDIPDNTIIAVANHEYLGGMPVRFEIVRDENTFYKQFSQVIMGDHVVSIGKFISH